MIKLAWTADIDKEMPQWIVPTNEKSIKTAAYEHILIKFPFQIHLDYDIHSIVLCDVTHTRDTHCAQCELTTYLNETSGCKLNLNVFYEHGKVKGILENSTNVNIL